MADTPSQKWQKQIVMYKKQCQKIMSVSKSIRYSGIINEYGRTLAGVIRPGTKPLLKSDQVKNEFFIISTLITLRKYSSNSIGNLDFIILKHQKVSIAALQKNQITYYVSIDPKEKDIDKIVNKIKKII